MAISHTFRKHWITYIAPSFVLLFGLLVLLGSGHSSFGKAVGIFIVFVTMSVIFQLINVKWTLTESGLRIQRGVLPWRKTDVYIPIDNLYNSYTKHNMTGHFLNYANVYIRRTDGMTSGFSEARIGHAKELSNMINGQIAANNLDRNKVVIQQHVSDKSIASELKILSDLRSTGDISDQEYQRLKKDLIDKVQ